MQRLLAPAVLAIAMALSGCATTTPAAPTPVHGFVTDMKAFDAFIATHPTPEQFHAAYPDVQLVMRQHHHDGISLEQQPLLSGHRPGRPHHRRPFQLSDGPCRLHCG